MTHKERLLQRAADYLDSQNWRYRTEGNMHKFGMNIKCKLSSCEVIILASDSGISCLSVCPLKASKDAYANVVEFITRANYGLRCGGFEFDYRDGEIRYRTFLSAKEYAPDLKDVEHVVDVAILMMKRYGDGLAKNLMGYGDPARDIEEIESR